MVISPNRQMPCGVSVVKKEIVLEEGQSSHSSNTYLWFRNGIGGHGNVDMSLVLVNNVL